MISLEIDKKLGITITMPQICHFCHNPITNMNGYDPESLCNHHITYVPEVKIPMHKKCHQKYHNTHPDHPKSPEIEYKKYRKEFVENLDEDILCHFCGKQITKMDGVKSDSLIIHSLDGNHNNWDPTNKAPAHNGCHTSYHQKGKDVSEKTRDLLRGDNNPSRRPEQRQRMRDHSPMKNPEVPKKVWKKRRELYGPTGFKGENPMKRPEVVAKVVRALEGRRSEIIRRTWETRRLRYGVKGFSEEGMKGLVMSKMGDSNPAKRLEVRRKISDNNPMKHLEVRKKMRDGMKNGGAKQTWETRRRLYGPTGMKPKTLEDVI